ncbi:MAG: fibronectin type III domain-containing protein [Candidatus Hatepunaea meridiana]|nr:fibronectin type III domain-containing protein [Candidatus Hatepunaea meridiana]
MFNKTLYFLISLTVIFVISITIIGCKSKKSVEPPKEFNPPDNLTAEVLSTTEILLSWQDNSDNEEGFQMEESISNDSRFIPLTITDPDITSMTVRNLQADRIYFYRVRAFSYRDTSNYSNIVSVTTPYVPLSPENLVAELVDGTEVRLTWNDNSDNEDGFEIEESEGDSSDYQLICKTGSDTTTLTLIDKSPGTTYYYRVRAYLGTEYSDYSNSTCVTIVYAEQWNQVFGGALDEEGHKVRQTPDGGFIVVGSTKSFGAGDSDVWLIKTDANGNEQWNKTFGGLYYDYGSDVRCTTDGGYIIVGYTASFGEGDYDVWLIKVDASGDEEWNQTIGGSDRDKGYGVHPDQIGGYIVVGSTRSYGVGDYDTWIIRTDHLGHKQEDRTIGEGGREEVFCIEPSLESGFDVVGSTQSFGSGFSNACLFRIDNFGRPVWRRYFGLSNFGKGLGVNSAHTGGTIITGYIVADDRSDYDLWFIRVDYSGQEVWNKTFGGDGNEKGYSCHKTEDGGYVVIGLTDSFGKGDMDAWLIKTDGEGNELWNMTLGGTARDEGFASQPTTDGGYIITGSTESFGAGGSDVWLIKVGS